MTSAPASRSAPLSMSGLVRCALAAWSVAYFFTGLDDYGQAVWGLPPPVYFVVAALGVAAVLVAVDLRRPLALMASPVGAWILLFFVVTTAWAVSMRDVPETLREIDSRYRAIGFLIAFVVIFDDPRARRVAMLAVAAAVAVAALLNVAELFSLITFADIPTAERTLGRPGGFYVNPNVASLAIALGVCVAVEHIPRLLRTPLVALSAVGVAATFSRGGAVCLAVVFAWLAWRGALGSWRLVVTTVATVAAVVVAFQVIQAQHLLNDNTAARLALAKDDSGRIDVAFEAWKMFGRSPWLGNGLGSTYLWNGFDRPHDMFLNFAADQGIVGLLLFPALGVALARRHRAAVGLAVALMIAGVFSHNLLEDRSPLLLIALVAAGGVDRAPTFASVRAGARRPALTAGMGEESG